MFIFISDNLVPLAALSISNADLAMMRVVLNKECQIRNHDIASVEGKRVARLIMDGFRDGLITETSLAELVRRDGEVGKDVASGRYLKNFPSWR